MAASAQGWLGDQSRYRAAPRVAGSRAPAGPAQTPAPQSVRHRCASYPIQVVGSLPSKQHTGVELRKAPANMTPMKEGAEGPVMISLCVQIANFHEVASISAFWDDPHAVQLECRSHCHRPALEDLCSMLRNIIQAPQTELPAMPEAVLFAVAVKLTHPARCASR